MIKQVVEAGGAIARSVVRFFNTESGFLVPKNDRVNNSLCEIDEQLEREEQSTKSLVASERRFG